MTPDQKEAWGFLRDYGTVALENLGGAADIKTAEKTLAILRREAKATGQKVHAEKKRSKGFVVAIVATVGE